MKLRFAGLALAFLAVVSTCSPFAFADVAATNVQTGTISATGPRPSMNVQGDNVCQLQFTGAGTATVTIQGASDYVPTWNSLTGVTSIAMGAGTSLNFAVNGTGTTNTAPSSMLLIRVNVTVYGSTPIPYTLTCSGQLMGAPLAVNVTGGSGLAANVTIVAPTDGTGAVKVNPNTTVTPTATPSAMPAGQPVIAVLEAQCGTSGLFCPVSSAGGGGNGNSRSPLNVAVCKADSSICALPTANPADASTNTQVVLPVQNYPLVYNGTTWDRPRSAASPAPTGVIATGYNALGAVSPVFCNKSARLAGTAVNTLTQVVALSGTTNNYICGWSAGQVGTVLLDIQLSVGTGTNCGTTNVVLDEAVAANATNMMFVSAYGYPLLQSTAVSQEICVDFLGTTSTTNNVTVYYSQF